jgi:heme exporter protein CcmD
MVETLGPHAGYILASYAVGILIMGGMILNAWLGLRKAQARLARLERQKAEPKHE